MLPLLSAHDVGWLLCGVFTIITTITSLWLVWKHLTYYTCPLQQRHIIRMLFMPPIYAIVSTLSYLFYREALYYQIIRDCYEAVVITSFFYLFLQYLGDTKAEQYAVFKDLKVKGWMFPLGFIKRMPTGLGFLWIMKICILQYAIVRPVCTLVSNPSQMALQQHPLTFDYPRRFPSACNTLASTACPHGCHGSATYGCQPLSQSVSPSPCSASCNSTCRSKRSSIHTNPS